MTSKKTTLSIRIVALATILFAPLLSAHRLQQRAARQDASPGYTTRDDSAMVARYYTERNPVVDNLLPEGSGGTLFRPHLKDGVAGVAIAATATIMLAINNLDGDEGTELHERAHLLHAYHPAEVNRLVARLPRPARGQYAASNSAEHFAEMASTAWRLVYPPEEVCFEQTPSQRLHSAEVDVPGTAGFVIHYLRAPGSGEREGNQQLLAAALELAAPLGAEWDAIWAAVERRRLPGGTLAPWQASRNIAGILGMWRADEWHSGAWWGKITSVALVPSAALANVFGPAR
jgi:hypothetical protein